MSDIEIPYHIRMISKLYNTIADPENKTEGNIYYSEVSRLSHTSIGELKSRDIYSYDVYLSSQISVYLGNDWWKEIGFFTNSKD